MLVIKATISIFHTRLYWHSLQVSYVLELFCEVFRTSTDTKNQSSTKHEAVVTRRALMSGDVKVYSHAIPCTRLQWEPRQQLFQLRQHDQPRQRAIDKIVKVLL